jgi:hypothetical protein
MKNQENQEERIIERRVQTPENEKEMRKVFLKSYYKRLDKIISDLEKNNPLNNMQHEN